MDTLNSLRYVVAECPAGTKELGSTELHRVAYAECVELRVQSYDKWHSSYIASWESVDRYSISAYDGVRLIGRLILVKCYDIHVGDCMAVHTQYVLPQYRNSGITRRLLRTACALTREHGLSVLSYTHRKSDWVYHTTYRRIHGQRSIKSSGGDLR